MKGTHVDQYFDVIEDAKAQMYEVTCKSPQPNGVRAKVVYILKDMHWKNNVLNNLKWWSILQFIKAYREGREIIWKH